HQPVAGLGVREPIVGDGAVARCLRGSEERNQHERARDGAFSDGGNHSKTPLTKPRADRVPAAFSFAAARGGCALVRSDVRPSSRSQRSLPVDWTTGPVDQWTSGRLDDWTTGRLEYSEATNAAPRARSVAGRDFPSDAKQAVTPLGYWASSHYCMNDEQTAERHVVEVCFPLYHRDAALSTAGRRASPSSKLWGDITQ